MLRLLDQRSAVALDRLLRKAPHRQHARLELAAHCLLVVGPQLVQPVLDVRVALVGALRQIKRQQVQHDVLDVLDPVVRVDPLQLPQHPVVLRVLLQLQIHQPQLAQPIHLQHL